MPERLCPKCNQSARLLTDVSAYAHVNYFRCDRCGHVWSQGKDDPNAILNPVSKTPDSPSQN